MLSQRHCLTVMSIAMALQLLGLALFCTSFAHAVGTSHTSQANHYDYNQQQQRRRQQTTITIIDANAPQEKEAVTTAPILCTSDILTDADIGGNQFISRAEYVNLLLDLAPHDCPVIESWLSEILLQSVFDELSCLCHEFGGIDGQDNCCLQAVGTPMLAAFAAPTHQVFPEAYTTTVCEKINAAIALTCPTSVTTTTTTTTVIAQDNDNDDATTETTTTTQEPSPETEGPITTAAPTEVATEENTQAGGMFEILVHDGQIIVEEEDEQQQDDPMQPDSDDVPIHEDIKDSTTPVAQGPATESVTANSDKAQEELNDTSTSAPAGIIVAIVFLILIAVALVGIAFWAKYNGLLGKAPGWAKFSEEDSVLSNTKDDGNENGSDDIDGSNNNSDACIGEDLPTPIRSNSRRNSFSSDDGDSSTDEELGDEEMGNRRYVQLTNNISTGVRKDVVRVEFQDNLSVWGRKKRRKTERKQRREERRRASLEAIPHERKNNMSEILSTLEMDLSKTPVAKLERLESSVSSSSDPASSDSGQSPSPVKPSSNVDIFDDSSDTSSYAGSPQSARNLTESMETSIEDWLGSGRVAPGTQLGNASFEDSVGQMTNAEATEAGDRSLAWSSAGSFAEQGTDTHTAFSTAPVVQRQSKDPVLQNWNAQRQDRTLLSTFGSFPVKAAFEIPTTGRTDSAPRLSSENIESKGTENEAQDK